MRTIRGFLTEATMRVQRVDTRLRTLFIAVSIMAMLSFSIGGFLYYSKLSEFAVEQAHQEATEQLKILKSDIDAHLANSLLSAEALSGLQELQDVLLQGNDETVRRANAILDHFKRSLKVSVCYLMDISGRTLASSNRNDPDSFVGKNYGFRPYFMQAAQGKPTIYMALGITSKERGVYYSHPVFAGDDRKPAGVAVIKASIALLEKSLLKFKPGIVLLTDPNGVIFFTNRAEWLYHLLWEASGAKVEEIRNTKQFGPGPWPWTGMRLVDQETAVDVRGDAFRLQKEELANYPGWRLISMYNRREIVEKMTEPLRRSFGPGIVVLCLAFGAIVSFLFFKANDSITQRKLADDRQIADLSALNTASGSFCSTLEMELLSSKILETFLRLWSSNQGVLMTNETEGDRAGKVTASIGIPLEEAVILAQTPEVQQALEMVTKTGEPFIDEGGTAFNIYLPLVRGFQSFGAVLIRNTAPPVQNLERADFWITMTSMAATALENAWLYNLATVDSLTRLYVRRYFMYQIEQEFKRAQRYGNDLSLILSDIDHFKSFNDTYGHQQGDSVLKEVAGAMRKGLRDTDVPARYGGEEFAFILPETDSPGAIIVAERLRLKVMELIIRPLQPKSGQSELKVTVSLGVVSLADNQIASPEQMIKLADIALYRAKGYGRNRVVKAE